MKLWLVQQDAIKQDGACAPPLFSDEQLLSLDPEPEGGLLL
jgi:hypothetical protein